MRTHPLIFNIQRFCTHDGPGIRTVVFFKGCPLRCRWCSNPESQDVEPNLLFNARRCIGCGQCAAACPQGIVVGRHGADPACNLCGACVAACPAKALEVDSREYSIADILAEVSKDENYYYPLGGVTLSGGEPLLYPEFTEELATAIKKQGYHLAVETTGFAKWEIADPIFAQADLLLYDIKHMDDEQHKLYTGVSNRQILQNAITAAVKGYPILVRIPLIGGVNDSEDNIRQTALFCAECGIQRAEFLPYHKLGASKYDMLRKGYAFEGSTPAVDQRRHLATFFTEQGVDIIIGN